jgi:hypothetical protein
MKRLLTFTVLLTVLIGGAVFATDTRVNTMGNVNTIVKDEANVFQFPSTVNYYPKLFLAEVGERNYFFPKQDQYDVYLNQVGAHFQLDQKSETPWVVGAYFDTRTFMPSIAQYIDWWHEYTKDAGEGSWSTNHRITAVVGREFNAMPVGFILSYYNMGQKNEDTMVSNNYDESFSRFEFSFGLSPMQKKLDLGFGVAFTTWKDKDFYNSTLGVIDMTKPKGNMDLFLNARYWMDPMGKYTLVPHFGVMYSKQGAELYDVVSDVNTLDNTHKITDLVFDLGLGMNYDAAENVLVVGDIGFNYDAYKTTDEPTGGTKVEVKDNYLMLPYFRIGIDAYVFKWMNLRSGVVAQWQKEKYEPSSVEKRTWSWVETQTFLGAGFHWGNFVIDANIDPDFLSRGPYFITGSNDGNYYDISNKITLKYLFD